MKNPAASVRLVVHPGRGFAGAFRPPGDKSVTHRAILLALLANGMTVIENANPGRDCSATLRCAEMLGLEGKQRRARFEMVGTGFALTEPDRVLDCGNSGTTLRLLSGVLAARPFLSVLEGDASLNRRPVGRVIEPLTRMGANLWARGGDAFPPLAIRGAPLHGVEHQLSVASAQVASSVIFAGLQAEGRTSVTVPGPARDHTERMLQTLGVPVEIEPLADGGRRVTVTGPAPFAGGSFSVPGDFSAAAFFLAAAAATPGSAVTGRGVNLNPTRTGLLDVLERMGAEVERGEVRMESGEEVGDVTVRGPEQLVAIEVPREWVPRMLDEIPAWAIAAARARGTSRLRGAAELRVKESDRIAALADGLTRLGVTVREYPDGLEIDGGFVSGGEVDAAGDHRIAMALAALGVLARGSVRVAGAENIETSYPSFVAHCAALGGQVETVGAAAAAG